MGRKQSTLCLEGTREETRARLRRKCTQPDSIYTNTHPPPLYMCMVVPSQRLSSMVQQDTMGTGSYGRRGSPWEFNLRDVFRWCEVMVREQQPLPSSSTSSSAAIGNASATWEPWLLVDSLYIQRMRTRADRDAVLARFREVFPEALQERFAEPLSPEASCVGISGTVYLEVEGRGIGTHPVLRMTPDWMQVGPTVLPRGCWANSASRSGGGADEVPAGLAMPLALRRPLQALAR